MQRLARDAKSVPTMSKLAARICTSPDRAIKTCAAAALSCILTSTHASMSGTGNGGGVADGGGECVGAEAAVAELLQVRIWPCVHAYMHLCMYVYRQCVFCTNSTHQVVHIPCIHTSSRAHPLHEPLTPTADGRHRLSLMCTKSCSRCMSCGDAQSL